MSEKKRKKERAWDSNGLQDWGSYMAAKKSKLEDQFDQLAQTEFQNATNLFRGIAIFVNGYTNPCADVLKRLMMEHGGIYHTYQRSNTTTHLIASNLPYSKIIQYRKSKNPLPLCKPEWITDSIKANKLLDWRPYLLYNNTSVTQPQLQLKNSTNEATKPSEDIKRSETSKDSSISAKPQETPVQNFESPHQANKQEKLQKIHENHVKTSGTALCSKDEEFISEFYNNSRLHHIATMGATFKDYVNELRSKNNGSFPGLNRLKSLNEKQGVMTDQDQNSDSDDDLFSQKYPKRKKTVIMHIDMDCFFVSVGLRNQPELRGHPVAVTHAKGNNSSSRSSKKDEEFCSMSEIASCSYEARKVGLKNGMLLGHALKLCPNLKTIKYDFEGYKEVSYTLYNTVASYTLDIEPVSCDEMYADISKVLDESNLTPSKFAAIIRAEIKEKTGCPVSTGFGNNKLQARLATKRAKPDGQFHLKNRDVEAYIGEIGIGDIPGVGWSTMRQLRGMNVELCRDLRQVPLGVLQEKFGKKTGEMLFNTCRGIDQSKLCTEHVRKSVSAEVNYGIRFESDKDARGFLIKLAQEVCSRLKKIHAKGRCVTLKLMVRAKNAPVNPAKFMGHGLCDNFTKSKNFMAPIDHEGIITKDVLLLWEQMQQPATEIRGIGIQISRLESLKSKIVNNKLMEFIAKGNRGPKEKIEQISNFENENCIYEAKKDVEPKKPEDFKAFFSSKKLSIENPKRISNHVDHNSKIDESVLAELPEDIRLEILKIRNHDTGMSMGLPKEVRNEIPFSKPMIKKSQSNGINNYFKHKKPGTTFSESKIPTIQELDMEVLIELPDDIRNEILNEYRMQKNELSCNTESQKNNLPLQEAETNSKTTRNNKNTVDELNYSFSQVDPEFLSALDDETRNDVKRYFLAKKSERESKLKKIIDEKPQNPNKNHKIPLCVNKKLSEKGTSSRSHSFLQNELSILGDNGILNDDRGEHINTYRYDACDNIEQQQMLNTLVNYLFSLPIQQVKRQIQTWINNSNNVNKIDSLSLITYLSMLPKEKRIEDLHTLMKTMHRCMTETGSCVWHRTYRETVEHVQQRMQIEYHRNLMLPAIRCNFCSEIVYYNV